MTYLPDVNVWIALAAERHIPHPAARQWFTTLEDERLAFCRITQLGFLRLLTNKHVMQEEVLNPTEAWRAYHALRSDRRVEYVWESVAIPETWDAFTKDNSISPSSWTDSYLCAFAHAAGFVLITFDKKIATKNNVACVVLQSPFTSS
jgi:uncharacterized protein